jgi:hypothetical protein
MDSAHWFLTLSRCSLLAEPFMYRDKQPDPPVMCLTAKNYLYSLYKKPGQAMPVPLIRQLFLILSKGWQYFYCCLVFFATSAARFTAVFRFLKGAWSRPARPSRGLKNAIKLYDYTTISLF